jgi:hypothetical protein
VEGTAKIRGKFTEDSPFTGSGMLLTLKRALIGIRQRASFANVTTKN